MEKAVPILIPLAELGKEVGKAILRANLGAGAVMAMEVEVVAGAGTGVAVPRKVAGGATGVKVVIAGARAATEVMEDLVAIAGAEGVTGGRGAKVTPGRCPS